MTEGLRSLDALEQRGRTGLPTDKPVRTPHWGLLPHHTFQPEGGNHPSLTYCTLALVMQKWPGVWFRWGGSSGHGWYLLRQCHLSRANPGGQSSHLNPCDQHTTVPTLSRVYTPHTHFMPQPCIGSEAEKT